MMNGIQQIGNQHSSEDSCSFGLPSPMELTVFWGEEERCFPILEFGASEVVVADCEIDECDLRHREASLQFCDGELMDEVPCRVIFRGFLGADGLARFRLVTDAGERIDVVRMAREMRARSEFRRELHEARLAVACGWI